MTLRENIAIDEKTSVRLSDMIIKREISLKANGKN